MLTHGLHMADRALSAGYPRHMKCQGYIHNCLQDVIQTLQKLPRFHRIVESVQFYFYQFNISLDGPKSSSNVFTVLWVDSRTNKTWCITEVTSYLLVPACRTGSFPLPVWYVGVITFCVSHPNASAWLNHVIWHNEHHYWGICRSFSNSPWVDICYRY